MIHVYCDERPAHLDLARPLVGEAGAVTPSPRDEKVATEPGVIEYTYPTPSKKHTPGRGMRRHGDSCQVGHKSSVLYPAVSCSNLIETVFQKRLQFAYACFEEFNLNLRAVGFVTIRIAIDRLSH